MEQESKGMMELRPCPHCGGTKLSYRYWGDCDEFWELNGTSPENLLESWNKCYFPKEEDEDEVMLNIWEACVCCDCGAHVFGTIDKIDGEYDFVRRWNRRVEE